MGLLRRSRPLKHRASVNYMYDRKTGPSQAYYIALCSCGWMSDFFTTASYPDNAAEMRAAAAALTHDPFANTTLRLPLDEPKR